MPFSQYQGDLNLFLALFQTRFFAVVPTAWHNKPALRLEVHGCALGNDGTTTTERVTRPTTTAADVYPTTPTSTTEFFSNLPLIGGQVKVDTRLRKMETPYVVESSLVVWLVS